MAPMPRASAHPRDDILPETLLVSVFDMASSPGFFEVLLLLRHERGIT
jgi:hypothetical protein